MDDDIIVISDSDRDEETSKMCPKISDVKIAIENEKLSCKSKLDELRNRVTNLRKRQKGTAGISTSTNDSEDQSEKESSPPKKFKQEASLNDSSNSDIILMEDSSVSNGSSVKSATKPMLPSFRSMSEVSFESVIKSSQPSLLETKYTDEFGEPLKAEQSTREETDGKIKAQMIDLQHEPSNESETPEPVALKPMYTSNKMQTSHLPKHEGKKVVKERRKEQDIDEPQPLVKVVFKDEEIARMFHKAVHEALLEVFAVEDPEIDESDKFPGLELNIWESEIPEERQGIEGTDGLFKVDTSPVKAAFKRSLPRYDQSYMSALHGKPSEEGVVKAGGAGSSIPSACFNCEGDHMISECPKPINEEAVSKNRQKYMSQRRGQPKASRYHIDEEQRFAHLVPGKISDELREAMGLKQNQLPRFIYRMRMFGYPPGWLEEARITHSGITLINESSGIEAGEILANDGSKDTYDISKIVEYPGFNVPCNDAVDEAHRHRCPAMHWNNSKDALIQEIGTSAARGYKKKKLARDSLPADGTIIANDDMEVVEIDDEMMIVLDSTADSEVLEEFSQSKVEEGEDVPSSPALSGVCSQDSSDLSLLEAQKRSILLELEGNNSKSQPGTPQGLINSPSPGPCTPEPSLGRTMSLAMGTPVIDSHSPFGSLPCADKFSQGISDHLNFENLPDATGKFQQMKGIINKVRSMVDQLHQEEESSP